MNLLRISRSAPALMVLVIAANVFATWSCPVYAEQLEKIDNGQVQVGISRDKGGAITWLSSKAYPKNMVNIADPGRLIQQSYYAGKRLNRVAEGQHAAWSPWAWNPIQGGGVGSWAETTEFRREHNVLYSSTTPKLWDMPNEPATAVMRQWTEFEPKLENTIAVRCEFVSLRQSQDRWGEAQLSPQEVPACYFTRNFALTESYLGQGKWRRERQPPGPPWGKATPPLSAMACFSNAGLGIAVFSPTANQHWNFGPHAHGLSDESTDGPCMHVAPISRIQLGPQATYRYRYWLVIGDKSEVSESLDVLLKEYSQERAELISQ